MSITGNGRQRIAIIFAHTTNAPSAKLKQTVYLVPITTLIETRYERWKVPNFKRHGSTPLGVPYWLEHKADAAPKASNST